MSTKMIHILCNYNLYFQYRSQAGLRPTALGALVGYRALQFTHSRLRKGAGRAKRGTRSALKIA